MNQQEEKSNKGSGTAETGSAKKGTAQAGVAEKPAEARMMEEELA